MLSENTKIMVSAIEMSPEVAEDRFRYRYAFHTPSTVLDRAKSGNDKSLIILAYLLTRGFKVVKNVELGVTILQELAIKSNFAKLELSWTYYRVGDVQKSFELVQALDKVDYLPGTYRLMVLYKNGIGTKQNPSKYNFYLQKASDAGHVQAKKERCRNEISSVNLFRSLLGRVKFFFLNISMFVYFLLDRDHEKIIS